MPLVMIARVVAIVALAATLALVVAPLACAQKNPAPSERAAGLLAESR